MSQLNPLASKTFTNADQEVVPYDGSPVSWRVSAYVVILKGSEVLIIKNKTEKLYDIVGGRIEMGETIPEAVAREGREEAGATFTIGKLIYAEVDWFYHKKGAFYQTLQLFYTAELTGELAQPIESDITWREFVPVSEVGTKYAVPPIVERVIQLCSSTLQ